MNIVLLIYAKRAIARDNATSEINQKVENTLPVKEEFSRGEKLLAYIKSQKVILPRSGWDRAATYRGQTRRAVKPL
jgi:hypothetical protein